MKKDLLQQLKDQMYSVKDRFAFKEIVTKLENKTQKISKPGIELLKRDGRSCVMVKYLRATNTKEAFVLTKKRKKYLSRQILSCKKEELVIFFHITNRVTGNKHLNLLIVNFKNKTVSRIDPTSSNYTKITDRKVKKELIPFFKKFGLQFIGYDYRSKVIKHGKLCRYTGPAEYIYGQKLNYKLLKQFIISYFEK
jgi:hypothetical protein